MIRITGLNEDLFLGFPMFVWYNTLGHDDVLALVCGTAGKETWDRAIGISQDLVRRGYSSSGMTRAGAGDAIFKGR